MALYTGSKLTVSNCGIISNKWTTNAWPIIKADKEKIQQLFVEYGLSNNLDSREDHLVNFRGLKGYTIPNPEQEFHLLSSEDESEQERTKREAKDYNLTRKRKLLQVNQTKSYYCLLN